jgi:hypothetical protein
MSHEKRFPGREAAVSHDPVVVGLLDAIHEKKRFTVRDQCLRVFHGGTLPRSSGSREVGVLELVIGDALLSILTRLVGLIVWGVREDFLWS